VLITAVTVGGLLTGIACGGSSGRSRPAAAVASAVEELAYSPVAGTALGITLRRTGHARGLAVLVHGGGFRGGGRHDMDRWARWLSADGYATAAIDYRLASRRDPNRERALARAAHDTSAALTRLQADSQLRRLPVILWGYSAGALTVLRVAADEPRRVRAVVSLAGYGQPQRTRTGNPPMLLFNGSGDQVEPVSLASATCRAAHAVSVRCDQIVYRGATHAISQGRALEIHRQARAWLAGVLRGARR
jgi:dienelactone hydrolase